MEERQQRGFTLYSAAQRIAEKAEEEILSIRTNREEYLRLMVDTANELINQAWSTCRPDWRECDCGLDGCGEWLPETEAEEEISRKLFQPINRLMYHSRELIEAVGFEDSWKKED